MMLKVVALAFCLLLVSLQYQIWCAPRGGLLALHRLHAQYAQQLSASVMLNKRNTRLIEDIEDLRNGGLQALESHARYDLGMITSGEQFYRVVGSVKSS